MAMREAKAVRKAVKTEEVGTKVGNSRIDSRKRSVLRSSVEYLHWAGKSIGVQWHLWDDR